MPADRDLRDRFAGCAACVFDAYGTLFDVNAAAQRLADRLGAKASALAAVWRTKQLEYTWLRSLMDVHADFWQVTGEALDFALEDVGIAADADLRTALMDQYRVLDAYPDAVSALHRIRSGGKKTAILSNGEPGMLATAAESAGISDALDHVLSVESVGIFKPDRRTYQLAVEALAVPPSEICFVSSNAWDVAGAAHFGFRVVWCNRFGRTPERLPAGPAATVADLAALPDLLGIA